MTIDTSKLAKVKNAMDNRYENKQSNKKTDITGDYTGDTSSYPTVQAVKTYVEGKGYLTTHQDISGKEDTSNKVSSWTATTNDNRYPSEKLVKDSLDNKADASDIPTKVSDLTNDSGFLTSHQDISGKANTADLATVATTGAYSDLTGKPSIPTKVSDLTNDSGFLTTHQSLDSKTVTVEKQTTADTGYIATYVVKQNNAQVGSKINIPKDYLVKSATMSTCETANTPVTGYTVGDKYLDFVINTKDNSGTDEHLYILVSDLIDTYTAGSGLTLSNNEFSISNGNITQSMLSNDIPAKNITSSQISDWNSMVESGAATSDIDDRINFALNELAELIYPTSS